MQGWQGYLLAINIITAAVYGWDKWQSKRRGRRISEAFLIGLAVLGGTAGGLLAMYGLHHKTRHWVFRWGLPLILVIQLGAFIYFWTH